MPSHFSIRKVYAALYKLRHTAPIVTREWLAIEARTGAARILSCVDNAEKNCTYCNPRVACD